jgi:hypothetical protein
MYAYMYTFLEMFDLQCVSLAMQESDRNAIRNA